MSNKCKIRIRLVACVASISCLCSATLAADWSQFRGPNAAGLAGDAVSVPISFNKEKNLIWKTALPESASSPCVRGDRIFTTGFDRSAKKLIVYCVDRANGQIIWQRDVPASKIERTHSASTPANGTPAADDERVYVYFGSYGLLCYSHEGELLWSLEQPIPQTRNGSGTSPVITGELVLLNREENNESYLLAVDRRTGTEAWKHEYDFQPSVSFEGYATPVIWNEQAILHTHLGVRSIDLKTGELVWQVDTVSTGCSTPVIGGDHVYVATWNNLGEPSLRPEYPTFAELLKRDEDKNGKISFKEFPRDVVLFNRPESSDSGVALPIRFVLGEFDQDNDRELTQTEWEGGLEFFRTQLPDHGLMAIQLGGKGNVTATHAEVLEKQSIPEVPSPLYHRGRVYIVKRGGIVSCFQAETGKRLYRKRLKATKSYYASPIAVGDNIFFASVEGKISVVKASDSFQALEENDLEERLLGTPAVVDGAIYIRTMENLYAFGTKE